MNYQIPTIRPLDLSLKPALQAKIDAKTKPPGSLGRLEGLALHLGLIQNTLSPSLCAPTIVVCAADHGITAEGISPYPAEVTAQMALNFLAGGAAINVFARCNGLELRVVNAGVAAPLPPHPQLLMRPIAAGTANAAQQSAMTREQAMAGLQLGSDVVSEVVANGCNVIGFGDMGIGNTTAAALLMAIILDRNPRACVGIGAGLTAPQLAHKAEVAAHACDRARARLKQYSPYDPIDVLAEVGGFEIAAIAGGMLAAAAHGMVVLVDGFITTAALLVARALASAVVDHCVFCHRSREQAHRVMLEALQANPLLDMDLRLGEGTGAALAYPLLVAAVAFLNQMASFESAAISGRAAVVT